MPRLPRKFIVVDGGYYHVYARGNNKKKIFFDRRDYETYISLITKAKRRYRVSLCHYCLMPNHVHMLACPSSKGLSKFMYEIQKGYAAYFAHKYDHVGHVWQGRFKSKPIQSDGHLYACGKYIELNPVRAKIVTRPESWNYSSYRSYALGIDDPIVDLDPYYLLTGRTNKERQQLYKKAHASK